MRSVTPPQPTKSKDTVFTEAEKVPDASKYGTKRVVNWTIVGLGDGTDSGLLDSMAMGLEDGK